MASRSKISVRKAAFEFLSRREHSRYELWNKLTTRGYLPEEISNTLDDLTEKGLLSEERFIEAYVKSRKQRGYGADKIRFELKGKGVDLSQVEDLLNSIDWRDEAGKVAMRKFGKDSPSNQEESVKFRRYLRQRGFTWDSIDALIRDRD